MRKSCGHGFPASDPTGGARLLGSVSPVMAQAPAMGTKAQFPDEQSDTGAFQRQEDAFREKVSADASTPYPSAAGRYHLYISLACPWASRTLIVRNLKGLQDAVGVTVVDPVRDERGWAFRDGPRDPVNGFAFLSEAYAATDPHFDGRVTVPVLWDKADAAHRQ